MTKRIHADSMNFQNYDLLYFQVETSCDFMYIRLRTWLEFCFCYWEDCVLSRKKIRDSWKKSKNICYFYFQNLQNLSSVEQKQLPIALLLNVTLNVKKIIFHRNCQYQIIIANWWVIDIFRRRPSLLKIYRNQDITKYFRRCFIWNMYILNKI